LESLGAENAQYATLYIPTIGTLRGFKMKISEETISAVFEIKLAESIHVESDFTDMCEDAMNSILTTIEGKTDRNEIKQAICDECNKHAILNGFLKELLIACNRIEDSKNMRQLKAAVSKKK